MPPRIPAGAATWGRRCMTGRLEVRLRTMRPWSLQLLPVNEECPTVCNKGGHSMLSPPPGTQGQSAGYKIRLKSIRQHKKHETHQENE